MVHAHGPNENFMSCVEDRTSLSLTDSPSCPMDKDGVETTLSKLTFRSKRKESGLSMSLSKLSYELLIKGKQLEFYDPIGMSHMSVRIRAVEFSASATPPPLEENKSKDENQLIQRESQVQQQDRESEQMSMKKQGDKGDYNTEPYNSQDLTTSRKNPSGGTATAYCPKKFKRLRLSRTRCPINLSNITKERHQTRPCRHRNQSYSKRKIMNSKRKQKKVTFDDAQNHPKRRLGDIMDHCPFLNVSCLFNLLVCITTLLSVRWMWGCEGPLGL